MPSESVPTLYEWIGGMPVIEKLMARFYERVLQDDLLHDLFAEMAPDHPHLRDFKPTYRDFRSGDVRHSQADISRAQAELGWQPTVSLGDGLEWTVEWQRRELEAAQQGGQEQGVGQVEGQVDQVVAGRVQPEELHVQQMGKPGERVPVAGVDAGEGPADGGRG